MQKHVHNAIGKLLTREMTECSLQTSRASTAADKTSASAVYEPSSVALQTRLCPASFTDPSWTRNKQQVQRHQAAEEYLSPLMPAAKLQVQVAVDPLWNAASTSPTPA